MKNILLFLVVLLHTTGISAQNYQLIHLDRTNHFLNEASKIHSIRIDTNAMEGTDSFLYNHKILRGGENQSLCGLFLSDSTWLGSKIILKNNGDHIFFNEQNDSILIESLAFLNDQWTLYTFDNGDFIEANFSNIIAQEILGTMDSVKVITLQAKDSLGDDITHLINGKEIHFSKNHGIVKTFKLLDFPVDTTVYTLVGASNPDRGITNLTAREIFDYDIGDEFHFQRDWQDNNDPCEYSFCSSQKLILDKTISSNEDTITYLYEYCRMCFNSSCYGERDTTFSSDTITEVIILSSYDYLNQLSYELNSNSNGYALAFFDESQNRRQKININHYFYDSMSDCWQFWIYDPVPRTYIEGLGGGYYNNSWLWKDEHSIVYYKKGTEEWGTPLQCTLLSTSVHQLEKNANQVRVAPNPFSDFTKIEIENYKEGEIFNLKIFDAMGKEYYSREISQKKFVLQKKDLSTGIYFFQLQNIQEGIKHVGKLIVSQ